MAVSVKREADRVIERQDHTMRALIEALNVHLISEKGASWR